MYVIHVNDPPSGQLEKWTCRDTVNPAGAFAPSRMKDGYSSAAVVYSSAPPSRLLAAEVHAAAAPEEP